MNKLLKTTSTTITLVVFCVVLMSALSTPVFAEKGWCCKDGYVFESTSDECKEKGGKFFLTEKEAIKYCEDDGKGWCCLDGTVFPSTPELCKEKGGTFFPTEAEARKNCDEVSRGWCCLDGMVFPATPEECKRKGGSWFATKAEAEKVCEEGVDEGWCCLDGMVFPATPELCKKKGGSWFATKAEAEKFCETGGESGWCCLDGVVFPATPELCKKKGGMYFPTEAAAKKACIDLTRLPDLQVVNIYLNRKCQVVVKVKNNGPGSVPDNVWTIHTPKSSSVYIYINGKSWGGATIWKFDPGKSLKPPGGTAVYTSSFIVKTSAKITAIIDHTLRVTETNEINNKLVKVVRCGLKTIKGRR